MRVWGVRGRPAPGALKVSASYFEGWKASGSLIISGPEAGAKARAVLAKGTAVDLDPSRFRPGQVAATQMAHVGVHITAVAPDVFELLVFRSFAESLFEFLTAMAGEYGYEITAPPGSPA